MSITKTAGDLIRKLREAVGLSQQELATAAGVSRSAVSLWESGQTQPATNRLDRLFDALNLGNEDRRALVAAFGAGDPE